MRHHGRKRSDSYSKYTTVTVGNMAGRQIQETGILNGGIDATDDVTPTSKNHSMWDDCE